MSQNDPITGEVEIKTQICELCSEKNLTDIVSFNNCKECGRIYCLHFASNIDPAYCTECLHDVSIKEETIVKRQEHYNSQTEKVYTRTRKARRVSIGGLHWLFRSRKIHTLTDFELDLAIEYHRAILSEMLLERDQRRAEYAHRNRGKGLPIILNPGESNTVTTEETTIKKTRIRQATKADPAAMMQAAMEQLLKMGMTPEMIAKAVAKK